METSGGVVNCGGVPVHYIFLYPETARYFRGYLEQESHCASDASTVSVESDVTAVSAGAVESATSVVSAGAVESAASAVSVGAAEFAPSAGSAEPAVPEKMCIQCTDAILIGGDCPKTRIV